MKKTITLLLTLISITSSLIAGGGHAARYQINLTDKENNKHSGYIYISSFDPEFDPENDDFLKYVFRNTYDSLSIYKEIKSMVISTDFKVDFTIKGNKTTLNKNDIKQIDLISKEKFPPDQNLIKLSVAEYGLIIGKPMNTSYFYNDTISENCSYTMLSWSDTDVLTSLKTDLEEKCRQYIDENRINDFYGYVNSIKSDLLNKKVIMFLHCSAM